MILDDLFLPEHPRVRPIRRAVDLLRVTCSKEEWDSFMFHLQTCLHPERPPKYQKKAKQLHAMALDLRPPEVTVRDTGRKRIASNQFYPFYDWVEKGPEWYRNLLRLKLELWALEVPPCDDQSIIRRQYRDFAKEIGNRHWDWEHHNQAELRIEALKKKIAAVPVPRKGWTEDEMAILGGRIQEESFLSLLDEIPPFSTIKTPISVARTLRNKSLSKLEEAARDYMLILVKDLPELDVANWPFLPFVARLPTEDKNTQQVLFVFRSNGKTSRVPRLAEKFGSLNLMSYINEQLPDDNNSLWLGQLDWGGDRVVLLRADSTILIRTWANASKIRNPKNPDKTVDLPFAQRFFAIRDGERVVLTEAQYNAFLQKKRGTPQLALIH
jgi:hypothetical protein